MKLLGFPAGIRRLEDSMLASKICVSRTPATDLEWASREVGLAILQHRSQFGMDPPTTLGTHKPLLSTACLPTSATSAISRATKVFSLLVFSKEDLEASEKSYPHLGVLAACW